MIILWNKQKGTGGSGGGGKFPIIVTDSGSSLPSASGYQEGDTFLNTSDKKIYKAEVTGYIANTDTTITCDIDYSTGIANNIKSGGVARRSGLNDLWGMVGTKQYSVKFKLLSGQTTALVSLWYSGGLQQDSASFVVSGNRIHHICWSWSYGNYSLNFDNKILDTEIVTDTIYILNITKTGTDCVAQLTLEDGTVVEEKNFTTTNIQYAGFIAYGESYIENSYVYSSNLSVYLGQSAGELVIPNTSTLSWDSGTSLTDKTEYADKTNGILYLYENDELVNIPQKNTLSFTNVSASSWVSDSTYADYGYKCEITNLNGVTSNMFAQVIFAPAQADSGNYATVCLTGNGTVTIYSKVNDTISIPSIVVMGV